MYRYKVGCKRLGVIFILRGDFAIVFGKTSSLTCFPESRSTRS